MRRSVLNARQNEADAQVATLGLGGNLGDPPATMATALRLLQDQGDVTISNVSRLYRTPPWGVTDQNWFFNCCVQIKTTQSARQLLETCLDTERHLKRERKQRWGPRLIDIDVLTFADQTIDEEGLTVPHPHLHERAFVLVPLMDVAPDLSVGGKTVTEWAAQCDDDGIEAVSTDGKWWIDNLT